MVCFLGRTGLFLAFLAFLEPFFDFFVKSDIFSRIACFLKNRCFYKQDLDFLAFLGKFIMFSTHTLGRKARKVGLSPSPGPSRRGLALEICLKAHIDYYIGSGDPPDY